MATEAREIANAAQRQSDAAWIDTMPVGAHRYGKPKFDRRLTDKILAAYNHAYAADEADVAQALRGVLEIAEARERGRCARPGASVLDRPVRRSSDAVRQAELWTRFVDARQTFVSLSIRTNAAEDEVRAAYDGMRARFARWRVA